MNESRVIEGPLNVSGYFVDGEGVLWQIEQGLCLYPYAKSFEVSAYDAHQEVELLDYQGFVLEAYVLHGSLEGLLKALSGE